MKKEKSNVIDKIEARLQQLERIIEIIGII